MFVIPNVRYTKMTLNRGLIYKDKEQISPCTRKTYAIVELTLYQGDVISRFYCTEDLLMVSKALDMSSMRI